MTQAEIGNAIANARKEQGITIRRMAEIAGLTPRAVQAVEKGWYNVGIETYLKLAHALKMRLKIE